MNPLQPIHTGRHKKRVVILMGVSGAGKTTTGKRLASALGWQFRDGDEFHPEANVAKMSAGIPLTDDDRWPWLDAISKWIGECCDKNKPGIVACSALKRVYRERLIGHRHDVQLVYLQGAKNLISCRMQKRREHFMPASLLDSQFETLEEPARDERVLYVNIALPPSKVVETIVSRVQGNRHPRPGTPVPGEK